MLNIGVLALQGDFIEHIIALENCRIKAIEVRKVEDLKDINGLIIPGGESTTIGKLLKKYQLDIAIKNRARQGLPIFGTCAGAILIAKKIIPAQVFTPLNLINIEIERNSYGRQQDSFEIDLKIQSLGPKSFHAYFIRAPRIVKVSPSIKVLARYNNDPVLIQAQNILASTFHPELSEDLRLHKYFIEMCR